MSENCKRLGLKEAIRNNIIDWCCMPKNPTERINWCILVLDRAGTKVVSSSCKMHQIYYEGITLVENLLKVREPVNLDAIYFITPTKQSIDAFKKDFPLYGDTKYKAAHIFFTQACPEPLFKTLSQSLPIRKIKSCKELNVAFVAFESQVYFLNSSKSFQLCYNPIFEEGRTSHLEELAIRISTVCYALNEYPSVRYIKKSNNTNIVELAHLVLKKLNIMKDDNPTMGDGYGKLRSQLIILDRSFDWISLILHELTFQAMIYDNLVINNDCFTFTENEVQKCLNCDQKDNLWKYLRHQHISIAVTNVSQKLKNCVASLRTLSSTVTSSSTGDLSDAIKKIPLINKSEKYSLYISVLKKCMDLYGEELENICIFEQDLVMGENAAGQKINYDIKNKLTSFLTDDKVSLQNKIRLIILYILYMGGVPEDIFNELVQDAQLSPEDIQTIMNLNKLGITTTTNENKKKQSQPKRKDRVNENTFQVSRWTPLIKDLMENCIENKLDPKQFPFVGDKENSTRKPTASSSRYTSPNASWYKVKDSTEHQGSRVILYILGGVSFSEMRCAYEVSKNFKNWEIVIGSSNQLTPNDFISELSKLHKQ